MSKHPLVSILMNCYNGEKYLKEAIDSIYAQTFTNWEVIFIDNCSTDDSKRIVDSYDKKIKYYKTEKNIFLGAARNFGLKFCNAKYIAFLDTDDIWLEDKLEKQIILMENNDDYQLCYGGVIYIDEVSKEIGSILPVATSEYIFGQQLKKYEINMQSVVLRNNKNLKFNDNLRHSPDFDLFMQILSKSKACIIKKYIVKYRKLEDSLTSKNIDIWWSEMKYTLDKIFDEDNELKIKYSKEYNLAYAKVTYNKARYLMSIGKRKDANVELSRFKHIEIKYFILYIISLFPVSIWNFIHRFK